MKDNNADVQTYTATNLTQLPPAQPATTDDNLPEEIRQSIAIANATSIGEQPAILANLALGNQILNNNLIQQNLISNQQAMNQILLATMAKCVDLIFAVDTKDSQKSMEDIKHIVKEFHDLINTQTAENIRAQQEMLEHHLETLKASIKTG